jgi:hypothetical protein
MTYKFNPWLTLRGNVVVHTLNDAAAFVRSHRDTCRPKSSAAVLLTLEEANDKNRCPCRGFDVSHLGRSRRRPDKPGLSRYGVAYSAISAIATIAPTPAHTTIPTSRPG